MKLCITHGGPGNLACTLEAGTLRHKQLVAYSVERVGELSSEIVNILHRGNRTHKLTESNLEQLRVVGEELARRLLPGPVLAEIRRTMGALTLELDEELLPFPWELFYDGEQFLCRRFDMGRLVRTSRPPQASVQRTNLSTPLRLLVVCSDPEDNLPQVEREGMEIVSQLDGNVTLLARMVTRSDLRFARREIKDYDLVHFAGHAEPPASESGFAWRLEDGLLSAKEISQMGAGRPMPAVVFSNACRSGVFNGSDVGEQASGLAQAFLLAGVRHYIGTQWEMVDGQGAQFARHLYSDLSRGACLGAAVRNARNRVIAESGEGQLAWASYVMYGDPEAILLPPKKEATESPQMPPLRLGVRATAPFKPREGQDSPITIEPLEEGGGSSISSPEIALRPARNGTATLSVVLSSLAAVLSLLVSGALAYYLLFYRGSPHPTTSSSKSGERRQGANDKERRNKADEGTKKPRPITRRDGHMIIHTHRLSSPKSKASIRDGLAVLEACLLDGLSRRKGLTVMQKPPGKPEPENRATHMVELQGHLVGGEVVMTTKLREAGSETPVSTTVIKAGGRLLRDCRRLSERLVSDAKKTIPPPPSREERPPRPRAREKRPASRF